MQPEKLALVSTTVSPEDLILRDFAATIGRKRYEHWFQKKTQVWVEGNEVVVAVSTPFLVNWMSRNFRTGLLASARSVMGEGVDLRFEVQGDSNSQNTGDVVPPAQGISTSEERHVRVDSQSADHDEASGAGQVREPHCVALGNTAPAESNRPARAKLSSAEKDVPLHGSREALVNLCRDSHAGASAPTPTTLNLGAVAASIAARASSKVSAEPSKKSAGTPIQSSRPEKLNATSSPTEGTRPNATRQAAGKPGSAEPARVASRTPVQKSTAEKSTAEKTADKPVPSVSRVTKDSPLTLAKVKPVEEPPRPGRRFSDLMDLVEGTCNEFALSAARQVCQAPGVQFTTLFVHGPVGVGKTHLLEGIHRDLKQRFPSRQVVYLTAEAFANFFTQALRDHKLPTFRNKFRSIDVLIVDDIDFLDGKRGIQEEFLFTIQQLESHGRMVVVGAHGHPRLLTKMSEELRTRFLAGMVCRIDAPDLMTRRRILENKAFRAGADFAPDVFQFVADRFRNNVRELEGAFNTLLAYQRMQGRRLSLTAARNALADLERDCIRVVRIIDIEAAVCSMFGVTSEDLKSNKRQKSLSQPRMLAMYLARKHTRAAYTEIGQHFGGRNHSTVIAAEKKIQASMGEADPIVIRTQAWRVTDLIESLEQQLQAG